MKLSQERIKKIILEELNMLREQEPPQEEPQQDQQADNQQGQQAKEDETKTLSALKQFMLQKTKETGSLKGASSKEVKEIAEIVDLMFGVIGKGEVSTYLKFAKEQLMKKTGVK